jgi:DNA-binding transcriptional regulator YiaG
MDEIWRDIEGTSGSYRISNRGRVIGVRGQLLKLTKMRIGYLGVSISLNGKPKRHYVHRLVASHFLTEKNKNFVVNHKDGNKHNNILSNLELLSRGDNAAHWASANRSGAAGRKRSGFCGRGHKFVGDSTVCQVCRKLKAAGVKFEPPSDCNWLPIKGFDYCVSDTGLVWSNKTNRLLKPGINNPGYRYVNLRCDGKTKNFSVSRLVAMHFISPIGNSMVVDHINSNKLDNRVENLRIISKSENSFFSRDKIRIDRQHGFKFTEKTISLVKWYALDIGVPHKDLMKHFKISSSFLSAIVKGRQWSHCAAVEPTNKNQELLDCASRASAKLLDIGYIKWLSRHTTLSQAEIARQYSVSVDTVSSIKVGRSYRDIEPLDPTKPLE